MQLVTLTPGSGYFGTRGLLVVRGPGTDSLRLQDGGVILDIGGREPTSPSMRCGFSRASGRAGQVTVMRSSAADARVQMPDGAASGG